MRDAAAVTPHETMFGILDLPALLDGWAWAIVPPKSGRAWTLGEVQLRNLVAPSSPWPHRAVRIPSPDERLIQDIPTAEYPRMLACFQSEVYRLGRGAHVIDGAVPHPARYRHTPQKLRWLSDDEVFVFGSNTYGTHDSGAARDAIDRFGAIKGQAEGLQGQSYGIDTMNTHDVLREQVARFLGYATAHPELHFYVTPIGLGIANWHVDEVAPLFAAHPTNVTVPATFDEAAATPVAASGAPLTRDQLVRQSARVMRAEESGARMREAQRADEERRALIALLIERGIEAPDDMDVVRAWGCPGNPLGACVFDTDNDPSRDDCLFCGEPFHRP